MGLVWSWVVLSDQVKILDECNDLWISLCLERNYVEGEVCQVTRIGTGSQNRDGHWSSSLVFL